MNAGEDYVIGIDGGTESIRVGLFDLNGNIIATTHEPYQTYFPQSGRAEQDPDEWWRCLCKATRRLLGENKIAPASIKGIALDATCCTVVFLDQHMQPLRRALLWMDVRAAQEAKLIAGSGVKSYVNWAKPNPLWGCSILERMSSMTSMRRCGGSRCPSSRRVRSTPPSYACARRAIFDLPPLSRPASVSSCDETAR